MRTQCQQQAAGPGGSKEVRVRPLFSEVNSPKHLSPGDTTGESECSLVGGDW